MWSAWVDVGHGLCKPTVSPGRRPSTSRPRESNPSARGAPSNPHAACSCMADWVTALAGSVAGGLFVVRGARRQADAAVTAALTQVRGQLAVMGATLRDQAAHAWGARPASYTASTQDAWTTAANAVHQAVNVVASKIPTPSPPRPRTSPPRARSPAPTPRRTTGRSSPPPAPPYDRPDRCLRSKPAPRGLCTAQKAGPVGLIANGVPERRRAHNSLPGPHGSVGDSAHAAILREPRQFERPGHAR